MTPAFSLALDAIRFLAALCVFFDHLSSAPFTDHLIPPRLGAYGDIAVTVFFVLSGFVIAHVVGQRERDPATYARARLSRLYSVALPALAVTCLADALGSWLNPDFYAMQKVLWKPVSLAGYGSALLFVNEFQVFGFDGIAPGTNAPYWSLSFEAVYYVLAGLLLFAPRRLQVLTIPVLLAAAGSTIAILAPIWALGFLLYQLPAPAPRARLVVLAGAGVATLAFAPELFGAFDNFGVKFPWGCGAFNRNLAQDYGVAGGFCALLHASRGLLRDFAAPDVRAATWIRRAGAWTFPLYCLHYPLLCLACAVSPLRADDPRHLAFVCLLVFGGVAALTPLCDALKGRLRLLGARRSPDPFTALEPNR